MPEESIKPVKEKEALTLDSVSLVFCLFLCIPW
jgi:hypothetical protein